MSGLLYLAGVMTGTQVAFYVVACNHERYIQCMVD